MDNDIHMIVLIIPFQVDTPSFTLECRENKIMRVAEGEGQRNVDKI